MKFFTITFLFFTCSATVVASKDLSKKKTEAFLEGYVVTAKNDTVKGWVLIGNHNFNSQQCVFKRTSDGPSETFTAAQIMAYGIPGKKYFRSTDVLFKQQTGDDAYRKVFLECIVSGRLSLFYLRDRYFVSTPDRVEELLLAKDSKGSSNTTVNKHPQYKRDLRNVLTSCLHNDEYLKRTELKLNSLQQLFVDYYGCTGENFTLYEIKDEGVKVKCSIMPALQVANIKFSSGDKEPAHFADGGNDWTTSFAISTVIELYRTEASARPRLKTGLTLYFNDFELFKEVPRLSADATYQLTVKSTRLEVPLLLKWPVTKGNTSFYLQGGVGLNINLFWNDLQVVTVPPSTGVQSNFLDVKGLSTNFLAGAGVDVAIGRRSLIIDLSYGINPFIMGNDSNSLTATLTSLTFGVGLRF